LNVAGVKLTRAERVLTTSNSSTINDFHVLATVAASGHNVFVFHTNFVKYTQK